VAQGAVYLGVRVSVSSSFSFWETFTCLVIDKDRPVRFYWRNDMAWGGEVALLLEWLARSPVKDIALGNIAWGVTGVSHLGALCGHLFGSEHGRRRSWYEMKVTGYWIDLWSKIDLMHS